MGVSNEGLAVQRIVARFGSGQALADAAGLDQSTINKITSGASRRLHDSTRGKIEDAAGLVTGTLAAVRDGDVTPRQVAAMLADEPTDPAERKSLARRLTEVEAFLEDLVDHLESRGLGMRDG